MQRAPVLNHRNPISQGKIHAKSRGTWVANTGLHMTVSSNRYKSPALFISPSVRTIGSVPQSLQKGWWLFHLSPCPAIHSDCMQEAVPPQLCWLPCCCEHCKNTSFSCFTVERFFWADLAHLALGQLGETLHSPWCWWSLRAAKSDKGERGNSCTSRHHYRIYFLWHTLW